MGAASPGSMGFWPWFLFISHREAHGRPRLGGLVCAGKLGKLPEQGSCPVLVRALKHI